MSEMKPVKRKKKKKKVIILSLTGVLVAGCAGGVLYVRQNGKKEIIAETPDAQSATAELGSISNTIVGTGNLALSEAEAQTLPSGIEIDEVMVESGDHVSEGDVIATVNKASVLTAIDETQEQIEELDEQIDDCLDDDDAATVKSTVDGRVKLIYIGEGDDIASTMLDKGALLVLSLDGKMAVDLEGTDLAEGDTVTVTLSSGTQVTGTVAEVSGESCTITLTDNGPEYDDTVTITDSDGTQLGTGKLYIHKPLEITGTTGTVKALKVSTNTSVSSGTTLLTLTDNTGNTKYQELTAQREALQSTLKTLLQLSQNQQITSSITGTVQSVNVSSSSSSSSSGTSSSTVISAQKMSSKSSGSVQISTMGYKSGTSGTSGLLMTSSEIISGSGHSAEVIPQDEMGSADNGSAVQENPSNEAAQKTSLSLQITNSGESTGNTLVLAAPETNGTPQTAITAADGTYTGTISWTPQTDAFQGGTVYQSVVTLQAADGYQFDGSSIQSLQIGLLSGMTVSTDGSTLSFTITWPQTQAADSEKQGGESTPDSQQPGTGSETANGQTSAGGTDNSTSGTGSDTNGTDNSANGSGSNGTDNSANGAGGGAGMSNGVNGTDNGTNGTDNGTSGAGSTTDTTMSGLDTGTMSGDYSSLSSFSGGSASGTSSAAGSVATQTDTSTTTSSSAYSTSIEAFTISPDEYMVLSVNVDELDINSVEVGQQATVTLDAIEDEEFTGEVTEINDTASSSGGVAKYAVSLSIPKDSRMKQGMNASATITIESRENVVTIPVNALQEKGSEVFVYTEQSEDGTLSGEQEVTTGLSDGNTVEITEGLSEGDTVYYTKIGSTQDSSGFGDMDFSDMDFSDMDFSDFGGGNGGDMPEMPSGDMPSGGGNGGGPGNMPNN